MTTREEVTSGESAVEVEEGRGVSPLLLLGALLFVFTFVLGWRSAAPKPPRRRDIVLPPLDGDAKA